MKTKHKNTTRMCVLFTVMAATLIFAGCGEDDPEIQNIPPEIQNQSFNASEAISETDAIGTVVATDTDGDDLTFSITTNDNNLFSITSLGALSIAAGQSLDFESATSHSIVVEVSDGEATASATVTIQVIDVDENTTPTIADQTFTVAENISDTDVIGRVVATDAEGDLLSFNIGVVNGKAASLFEISDSGDLSLTTGQSLDYETTISHTVLVEVSDGQLSASATMTINVTDVEEGDPPVVSNETFTVREDVSDTDVIGTIDATDPEGGTLSYSLSDPNVFDGLYEINQDGELSLSAGKNLDYESIQQYSFGVKVSDGDHEVEAAISIVVTDVIEDVVQVTTWAGNGTSGFLDGTTTGARFFEPNAVAVDASGNVYVSDSRNHRIRKINNSGAVTTFAGSGTQGLLDGTGTAAQFNNPAGIVVDVSGNVYVSDLGNHSIRKITPAGVVTTLAGSGASGFADGTGTAAQFNGPSGLAIDGSGNIVVADYNNHRIRIVTVAGVVSTLAGDGNADVSNGAMATARFNKPADVAVDASGNLYVADNSNHMIRKIDISTSMVSTIAGAGFVGYEDGSGAAAKFSGPAALDIDVSGYIWVADINNDAVRRIDPNGNVVTTVVGFAGAGYENGDLYEAKMNNPLGLAADTGNGFIYVVEQSNHSVRKIVIFQ